MSCPTKRFAEEEEEETATTTTPTGNHQSKLPEFGCSDTNGPPQGKELGSYCKRVMVRMDG